MPSDFALSALITFDAVTWAVGPGYYIARLWRFAKTSVRIKATFCAKPSEEFQVLE
jgi:hypothetical protein